MFVMVKYWFLTYIVRMLKNAWFRNTPTVEIPELKVTQYQTEDGVDVQAHPNKGRRCPNTIEHYQFTGTTNTNDNAMCKPISNLIETDAK